MGNVTLGSVLVTVGVVAAVWGCSERDGDSAGGGGRGGTMGSAGKGSGGTAAMSAGGTGGSAGSGGKGGAGGNAGKGGAGGTGGSGGGGTGGTGGNGSNAGKGGGSGTPGSSGTGPLGGQGGEAGDALGGEGGEGGEGGAQGTYTVAEACAIICRNRRDLPCDDFCIFACVANVDDTVAPTEYADLIQCEARELGPSDYVCREPPSAPAGPDWVGVVWGGPCERELCAWTCAEVDLAEEQTYYHCRC